VIAARRQFVDNETAAARWVSKSSRRMPPTRLSHQRLIRRYQVFGLAISLCLHGLALAGLAIAGVVPWSLFSQAAWDAHSIEASFANAPPGLAIRSDVTEPIKIRIAPAPVSPSPGEAAVSDSAQVTGEMVRERLDQVVAKAAERTAEENLDRLDEMSKRLDKVASADSVTQLAGTFQKWMGTAPRAERPAEQPAEGAFDYDTAQFHEVKRYPRQPSGYRYVAVLLDAAGRTVEVELDEPDGERVYTTLQRIKANPLLEQVYRQIALPLLDQMLAGVKQAAAAGQKLQHAANQKPSEKPPADEKDPPSLPPSLSP
jgi:hypothetical protein